MDKSIFPFLSDERSLAVQGCASVSDLPYCSPNDGPLVFVGAETGGGYFELVQGETADDIDVFNLSSNNGFQWKRIDVKNSNFAKVDSVTDLASEKAATGFIRFVSDLDRGGMFKAVNSGTVNDGTIFASATVGWTWQRVYDGAVSVKWFGAAGDGVTDDTAAIQSCFNLLGGAIKTLDFGDNTNNFLISYTEDIYSLLIDEKTDFEIIANGAIITLTGDTTDNGIVAFKFKACKRVKISGLDFNCQFSGNPLSYTISSCLFLSDNGVTGCEDIDIFNNTFKSTHSSGATNIIANRAIYALTDSNTLTLTKNIRVFNNRFNECDGRIVQFLAVNGGEISNNYFYNSGPNGGYFAIRLLNDCSNINVFGNTGFDKPGVTITGIDVAIFVGAGEYGASAGRVPKYINVQANSFTQTREAGAGTAVYGIQISQAQDISISSNFLRYDNNSLVFTGRGIDINNGSYYDAAKASNHVKCIDNIISGYQLSPERVLESGVSNIRLSNTYLDHSSLSGFFQIPLTKDNADFYTRQFEKLEKSYGGICQNFLPYSENLENSAWLKTNVTITQAGTNSFGTGKCNTVLETTDNGQHYFYYPNLTFDDSTTYIFSIRVKANGRDTVDLLMPSARFGGQLVTARFNLTTLENSIQSGNGSTNITAIGNDWYVIRVCAFCQSSGTGDVIIRLYNDGTSYVGDASKGMLMFGAQLNKKGIIPYSYTDSAAIDNYGGSFGNLRASNANFSQSKIGIDGGILTCVFAGTATLSSGAVTVSDSRVLSTSKIFLTITSPSGTVGHLHVSSISSGVSFDVDSDNAGDNSTFSYLIIN